MWTCLLLVCFANMNKSIDRAMPVDKLGVALFLSTDLFRNFFSPFSVGFDQPLDDAFGDEPDHAKSQSQKDHKGAELAGF